MPMEFQDKLVKVKLPFDDVDLILVTHSHGDHINLEMMHQHKHCKLSAVFVGTQQLVDYQNDSTSCWIVLAPPKKNQRERN